MCGIMCIISKNYIEQANLLDATYDIFKANLMKRGPDYFNLIKYSFGNNNLLFAASVLWLQGEGITRQPLQNDDSIFVYNGDIFGGIISDNLRNDQGDTVPLWHALQNIKSVSVVLSKIQGPYSFIFLNKIENRLYFGRDVYGRRSLLIGKMQELIVLTSVAQRSVEYNFIELPSIGTFCLDLATNQLHVLPWQDQNQNFASKLDELKEFLGCDITVCEELKIKKNKLFIEPSPEQLYLLKKIEEVSVKEAFKLLLNQSESLSKILKLKKLLEDAIEKRISTQPKYCKLCIKELTPCKHALTGVLFSGGVDCAILALLADKYVDEERPIDLINVAFDEVNNYETPDRLTGLQTLQELKTVCPKRKWNFLEINVKQDELNEQRTHWIADLIYPLQSVLDDSLGCALWFASRGKADNYISPCRVLLVGMGADELFGGYTRYRAALKKRSWVGLQAVLDEDWQNISHRNLARDDRVISDHGRQLRTPYLDENVVDFVRSLNCWEKTYPSDKVSQGFGEKYMLRTLAYYLGLQNAGIIKKRALQFGSRIANKRENAHDISTRLCLPVVKK